jgi:iron complex transport system substrate-binding protein
VPFSFKPLPKIRPDMIRAAFRVPGLFLGRLVLCLGLVASLAGCEDARAARAASVPVSLQTEKPSGLRWAKTLNWTRRGTAVSLTISEPWKGARTPLRYTLHRTDSGSTDPVLSTPKSTSNKNKDISNSSIVLPARRIVCLAGVHTGFLSALGATDRIVAVDAKNHVHDGSVRAGIESGRIAEVGSGSQLNVERLLAVKPDLVLANAIGASENQALDRLRRAGIPVVVTAEWMENHPLARAEWVRLIGVLIGAEARADSLFEAVEKSYLRLADRARARAERPTVLLGGPFRDQWFVSGGRSFMARLLADAGGGYLWADDTTAGGVPLSFEAVLLKAGDADVWLQPNDWRSIGDIGKRDARFARFGAFRRGDVYNNDARLRADGANDYWETGVTRPDRVLADLVSIFHGTEDTLYYYRRLQP